MIVTQIEALTKNRYKIFIDYEFAFVLYKGELCQYGISVDKEIKPEDYNTITQIVLPKRAKLRAMNLLQKKSYTEKQLRDKLNEGSYSEGVINNAIEYVKSYHYVDDVKYALDYITYHAQKKSLRIIEQELYCKGIGKDIFSQALMQWEEIGDGQDIQRMIQEHLRKKNYQEDCDINTKRKIFTFLLRKGYPAEEIYKAMQLEKF